MTQHDDITSQLEEDEHAFAEVTARPRTGEPIMLATKERVLVPLVGKRWAVAGAVALALALLVPVPLPHAGGWRWTSIAAAARDMAFHVSVDPAGKTDAVVASEVKTQLAGQGMQNPDVTFQRSGGAQDLQLSGKSDGREMRIHRTIAGGDPSAKVEMHFGDIDAKRRAGETDDALRQRILEQMKERGMEGDVEIHGDQVQLRVHKRIEKP